jgi:hypothetical protein
MRSLCGFALGGAGSSFYEQGFSCRPALGDCRILRPRRGAELFQQRLFRPRRVFLPLPKIGDHLPSHSAYLVSCCLRDGPLARWSLHGTIETGAQAIFLNAVRAALLQPVWPGVRFRHR